jgi:hypothetical protein
VRPRATVAVTALHRVGENAGDLTFEDRLVRHYFDCGQTNRTWFVSAAVAALARLKAGMMTAAHRIRLIWWKHLGRSDYRLKHSLLGTEFIDQGIITRPCNRSSAVPYQREARFVAVRSEKGEDRKEPT